MSSTLRAALIGLGVAIALAVLLSMILGARGAGPVPLTVWIIPVILGFFVTSVLRRLGGNRPEQARSAAARLPLVLPDPASAA